MPPTVTQLSPIPRNAPRPLRVAAYARVSSGTEAMLHSLSAQVSHYSRIIQAHPGWQYMGTYADEAYTGTKESRPEFQRLLADCRAGQIDRIVTKSISRLARNTVTLLSTVRELKTQGIGVTFEEQHIDTLSGDGELLLTILASYAQAESYSVSENCKWRIRKGFAQGEPNNVRLYGYRWRDGCFVVEPDEAAVVRFVFQGYLGGMGRIALTKQLNAQGCRTLSGKTWGESSLHAMLCNEKYTGVLPLQRTFVDDPITKRKRKNNGELPQYRVEDHHEAIIEKTVFEQVQREIARRATHHHPSGTMPQHTPFTGKVVCGHCGRPFRRKLNNAGTKYEKPVWVCPTFNTLGKVACPAQQVPENVLLGIPAKYVRIHVPGPFRLSLEQADGTMVAYPWAHPSRKDSWTDEMKAQARRRRCTPCREIKP